MEPKVKKIEKITKNTRSLKRKIMKSMLSINCCSRLQNYSVVEKSCPNRSFIFRVKEMKQSPECNENIVINLDLGKYGFDRPLSQCPSEQMEELLQNLSIFSANPHSFQIEWPNICNELSKRLEKSVI